MRTRMDGVHHKHRNISSAYLYETNARLYITQRSQSSVLVKQAKKNSFKMLSSICSPDLFCACAIFRIKHAVKNISLLASRMPVRLDFFLQFSFSMQCPCFLILCNILRSVNSRKAFKFLPKRLVVLLYGNQFEHKTTYLWSMRSPGGGELSLSACPGGGW